MTIDPHASVVNRDGLLASDLWLDQPDALNRIDGRLSGGAITREQAARLKEFVTRGFLSFAIDRVDLADRIELDVNRLWRKRPADLAFAHTGPLTSLADARPDEHRKPGYRLADLHSHSSAALELYLAASIHSWVGLILDAQPLPFQSLYFQHGTQQSLHRDPVYVVIQPPAHLLAAWVALEDIGEDCGPLCYIPGSHKVPYYEFEPGRITLNPHEDYLPAHDFTLTECRKRGMAEKVFTCRKGDVFLWHGSLVHGGSVVKNPEATRRSFVIHFSTAAHYRMRESAFVTSTPEGKQVVERSTNETVARNGRLGMQSPLLGCGIGRLESWRRRIFGL